MVLMVYRSQSSKELFNLRHSFLHNVVERIFRIFKRRLKILRSAPEYPIWSQVHLIYALTAINDYIRRKLGRRRWRLGWARRSLTLAHTRVKRLQEKDLRQQGWADYGMKWQRGWGTTWMWCLRGRIRIFYSSIEVIEVIIAFIMTFLSSALLRLLKTVALLSTLVKRGDLLPAGIHYWKTGSTEATQRDGHNRGTNSRVGSKGRLHATLLKCLIIDLYRIGQSTT